MLRNLGEFDNTSSIVDSLTILFTIKKVYNNIRNSRKFKKIIIILIHINPDISHPEELYESAPDIDLIIRKKISSHNKCKCNNIPTNNS